MSISPKITRKKTKTLILGITAGLFLLFGVSGAGHTASTKNVDFLNEQIDSKKNQIEEIQKKKKQYSQKLKQLEKEKSSLKNQLSILENRLAQTELEIRDTENQINKVTLEIRKTDFEIKSKKERIEKEKEHIGRIIDLLYKQKKADTLEILLLNESFSEFLNQLKYLQDINQEVKKSVNKLKQHKQELKDQKKSLKEKNDKLARLKNELKGEKQELEQQQESKKFLLKKTASSEDRYQQLLQEAKREREQISQELASLEKKVRARLEKTSKDDLQFNENGFIWPTPGHHVTVGFHDPDYPFRHLFEHPAIDIRASQGTQIKAAASGYVARVKYNPNSSKYAFIMLIHGDGMATVYGHISKPLVEEEQYVVQGQNIALSGGMPGTAGAGYLTTGPHLHFEVRKDGIPTDPLPYLPNN